MKKLTLLVVGLFYSVGAFAAETDFSAISQTDTHFKYLHLQKCLKDSWQAASPNETQKADAMVIIEAARVPILAQKDALKKDKQELMAAWAKYPILSQDVEAAEARLFEDMIAIHNVVRDDLIRVLNLLTADQKDVFNKSFKSCRTVSEEAPE